MAVADLLVGAVDIAIIRQVPFDRVCLLDVINVCLMHTFSWASLYHLTVVTWERYVAIRKWMDYKVNITKSKLKRLTIIAWFLAVLTFLPGAILVALRVDRA